MCPICEGLTLEQSQSSIAIEMREEIKKMVIKGMTDDEIKTNDEQIQKFKLDGAEVEIGIDHKEYSHTTKLSSANLSSLAADFS